MLSAVTAVRLQLSLTHLKDTQQDLAQHAAAGTLGTRACLADVLVQAANQKLELEATASQELYQHEKAMLQTQLEAVHAEGARLQQQLDSSHQQHQLDQEHQNQEHAKVKPELFANLHAVSVDTCLAAHHNLMCVHHSYTYGRTC